MQNKMISKSLKEKLLKYHKEKLHIIEKKNYDFIGKMFLYISIIYFYHSLLFLLSVCISGKQSNHFIFYRP